MREVNPQSTSRAQAFELWMKAPNPMVTFFKTVDVTRLVRLSRKKGYKFNMLLDWCIGKAASTIKEFYLLPVGDKLMQYDNLAVNTIVKNNTGEVSSCDILYTDDIVKNAFATSSPYPSNSTIRKWMAHMSGSSLPICKK